MTTVEVGVEIKDEELPKEFTGDFVTISLERLSLLSAKEQKSLMSWLENKKAKLKCVASRFIYSKEIDEEVLRERFLTIPRTATHVSIRLKSLDVETIETLLRHRRDWEAFHEAELRISIEADEATLSEVASRYSGVLGLRADPLWNLSEEMVKKSGDWGIQGRHPSRWIRYYSDSQLLDLARMANAHAKPLSVCFSHSKRWEQYSVFQKHLALLSARP